jgi:hypothetical protein
MPKNAPCSDIHKARIGAAQKRAWDTKRSRVPIGSTWIDNDGYVRVKVSEPCTYWRPEHLIVAEKIFGRELLPGEIVHHINIRPADNAEGNLFVYADKSKHNDGHRSINELVAGLLEDGIICFDRLTGTYKRCR